MPDLQDSVSSRLGEIPWSFILIAAMVASTLAGSLIGFAATRGDTKEYRDTIKYYELKGDTNAKATVDKVLKDLRR